MIHIFDKMTPKIIWPIGLLFSFYPEGGKFLIISKTWRFFKLNNKSLLFKIL